MENAIKYSPDGGKVEVKVWQEDGLNHLTISDDGIGIPNADLLSLFDRFHRGSNVDDRRFAGMGLGLYICKGIVDEHGGRIWAESAAGKGSTFHVTLPALQDAVARMGDELRDPELRVGQRATQAPSWDNNAQNPVPGFGLQATEGSRGEL
jgi:signal transduction histidine kinase